MSYIVITIIILYLLSLIMRIKKSLNKHNKIRMTDLGKTGYIVDMSKEENLSDELGPSY
jgi:hypothetical protein